MLFDNAAQTPFELLPLGADAADFVLELVDSFHWVLIDIDRTTARDITLETGSGSISVVATENARNIAIETGSGSVTVGLPSSFGAEVELETGSGGIDMDLPLTVRRWSRDHVTGTLGDGSGRLVIDTGSGSIQIREN